MNTAGASGFRATTDDLVRMRASLFFDGEDQSRKLSRFWVLMVGSSVIAAAGVASDSTATVIGAMLVAPLLQPIQGVVLAIVIADRRNLMLSGGTLLAGVLTGITIGYLFAALLPIQPSPETNSQIGARVSPGLLDLVAALATGVVGAFSQLRKDLGDSLPGVAIAVALVPPLSVVGITWHAGDTEASWGAMLLFLTNVSAILLTGVLLMLAYRVHQLPSWGSSSEDSAALTERARAKARRRGLSVVVVGTILIAVPLATSSISLIQHKREQTKVGAVVDDWARESGWHLDGLRRTSVADDRLTALVTGLPPAPDTSTLRKRLDDEGLTEANVEIRLAPVQRVEVPTTGTP